VSCSIRQSVSGEVVVSSLVTALGLSMRMGWS